MLVALALSACKREPDVPPPTVGPLGIPIAADGVTYAGAAVVDITPEITETYTDENGNFTFDGEPFDDADGDGFFDAVWIGGFGPLRPANGVHDPISVRAVVVAHDGGYVAIVGLDLVGLGHPRVWAARDALAADGFDPERLVAASSHNHQGPDTMGLWGNPYLGLPGFDPAYQERVTQAIEAAVRDAAAAMEPVDLRVGAVRMRDRGAAFNGASFGGINPTPSMHGMVRDGRDPVLVSDQLLVLQGEGDGGVVFTLTNWSGHPETRGSDNDQISADWVGVTRDVLEDHYGGIVVHVPESLGGMQSALGGDLPLVEPDGTHVLATCDAVAVADPADLECFGLDEGAPRVSSGGEPVPVWAPQDSWEFVTSHGWHIAEAAIAALDAGEDADAVPVRALRQRFVMPITNVAYNLLGPSGLFDMAIEDAIVDLEECPEAASSDVLGCFEANVIRAQIGPVGFLTVPGELLPELAWGLPEEDPAWGLEAVGQDARGAGARYFPQHPEACKTTITSYEECREDLAVGDCNCLSTHAWPYRISEDPGHVPLLELLDTPYRAMIGMADSYFSYVVPEPDFHHGVSLFTDDGDHYEDTVSASAVFGDRVLEAHEALAERW